jgi:hypothetical protein
MDKPGKIALLVIGVTVMALSAGCASQTVRRTLPEDVPAIVRKTVNKAPKDALIGIGKASETGIMAGTLAETRARAAISRQVNTIMQEMVRMYVAGSGLDDTAVLSFEERITVALSRTTLRGSVIICEAREAGNYWTAVMIRKDDAFRELARVQEEVKSTTSDLGPVDITINMNQVYDSAVSANITINQ